MSVRMLGPLVRRARVGPTVTSVKDLIAAISNFIDGCKDRCHPFVWTKTADQIIPSATRSKDTSKAGD